MKKEWEAVFREISMMGYALVFISHSKDKTFTRKDGTQYNQIVPSCSTAYNEIIRNMSDIQAYIDINGNTRTLILRSPDDSVECKCRFSQIQAEIPFSYDDLVKALYEAIDAEANLKGKDMVVEAREKTPEPATYDYDALMSEFETLAGELMTKDQGFYGPRITQIIEKYLGKGKKVSQTTIDQAELVYLIIDEIKNELLK